MMLRRRVLVLLIAVLVFGAQAQERQDSQGEAMARLATFKTALKAALMQGMSEGSLPEAVSACKTQAPQIAAAARSNGIAVGRSSLRLRNPANAPEDWMRAVLIDWEQGGAVESRQIVVNETTTAYVEPIVMQPLCLQCHGSALAPETAAAIAARYPADQATGYQAGDVRGLFWVTYPAPDAAGR